MDKEKKALIGKKFYGSKQFYVYKMRDGVREPKPSDGPFNSRAEALIAAEKYGRENHDYRILEK